MEISDFPPEELEVLEQLGSRDPRAELIAFVLVAKASRHRRQRPSIRSELKAIPERMNQIGAARPRQAASKSNLGEMSEEQKRTFQEIMSLNKNQPAEELFTRPRAWFSGLGKILMGAGLMIGDIGLATGLLPLPVVGQAATGSLISAATGLGVIFEGFWKLAGE